MGDKKFIISKDGDKLAMDVGFFRATGKPTPDVSLDVDGQKLHPIKYTLWNARVACRFGYDVPSPICSQYKWSGSYTPLNHQKATSSFFTINPTRAYCFNGLGSGKTLSALWAADYLLSIGEINRVLIISPLSTIPDAWERTLFMQFPHIKTHTVHGVGKRALIKNPKSFGDVKVFIANHEIARAEEKSVFMPTGELPIDLLIVDEGASFRAYGTAKSKGLKDLAKEVKYIWWMTATPTPNAPTDAWMQADIMGTRSGIPLGTFRDLTMFRLTELVWTARSTAPGHVASLLSPSICFKTEDCIDLPGITYQSRTATMSTEQRKIYTALSLDAFVELSNGATATALNEGIKANKLLQVACGMLYTDDSETSEIAAVEKLHIVEEILQEADTPIILFAPYRAVVKHLAAKFSKYSPEVIMGDVTLSERKRIFDAVQSGACRLLIAHPKTMSHGITLTTSSCIVWYAPVYSNETYEQANGRIYRQGQTKHCTIINITSCEVEKEIYYRLAHRQEMQGAILSAVRTVVGK